MNIRSCFFCGLVFFLFSISSTFAQNLKLNYPFVYKIYFTDVSCWIKQKCQGKVYDTQGYVVQALKALMLSANKEIHAAIYGLRNQNWFLNTLRYLKQKGVDVKIVVDQQAGQVNEWNNPLNFYYFDTPKLFELLSEYNVKSDVDSCGNILQYSIMHNKFLVIDNQHVWLGSANISETDLGAEYNANVAISISSKDLAQVYNAEFNQMFYENKFSTFKSKITHDGLEFSDGTIVRTYFSPKDSPIFSAIIPFINTARKSLDIAMFYLTHPDVAKAIVNAVKRKVKVRIILDSLSASSEVSQHQILIQEGAQVKFENFGGKMHMKSAVADDMHVVIGSMNWSKAGNNSNDENTLVIFNNQTLALEIKQYFDMLWSLIPQNNKPFIVESLESINSCFDGIDNDYDGYIDFNDFGCQKH